MSEDHLTFDLTCTNCGQQTKLTFEEEDPTDDSTAKCSECGVEVGRYGDIKAKAMELAKEHASQMFKDAFKDLKGWKVR